MSINQTLEERETTHGDFSDNSRISQQLKMIIRTERGYKKLSPVQAESLDMILHKVARIIAGDNTHVDSWHDIAGYATLVEERLSTSTSHN